MAGARILTSPEGMLRMKVKLLSFTPDALTLLLRTKNTRLRALSEDPASWTDERRAENLAYMRDTIKSSWEFVDYVFEVEGVTRAFTHQYVRTRTGSYAQESQRASDVSENGVLRPESVDPFVGQWDPLMKEIISTYKDLLEAGVPAQDARGLLPTNVLTSITAKFNLRTLHEMAKVRLCTRTQGEYQEVFRKMRAAVISVHPWTETFGFLEPACVADGVCAFPRYGKTECPVYFPELDRTEARKVAAERYWSQRYESRPELRASEKK